MNKVFRTNNSEKGFVLILLPFVLVIMLGALALMIDLTNIYSAKVKAENAVDLGVLSAVQSFITERSIQVRQGFGASGGPQVVSPTEKEYIKSRFGQSVRNNLRKNGILLNAPSGSGSLKTHLANTDLEGTIQFTPIGSENIRVTGTVELSQPLFFGGVWDHIAGSPVTRDRTVRGMASSDLLGSVFVFVLDLSSSQNCPSNSSTNCVCNTANRATVGGNCRTEAQTFGDGLLRIEEIVKATRAVASSLDRRRDRLAIIVYNNAAKMLINFGVVPAAGDPTPPGFDMAALNAALNRIVPYDAPKSSDSIFPNGNTNISDALITARDELVRANLTTDEFRKRLNVVLLTDGAPTAMRVNLASLKSSPDVAALPAVSKLPNDELPLGRNEFLAFQLTRRDGLGNFINFMSPLVEVQRYKQMIYAANGDQPYPLAPFSVTGNTDFPDSMLQTVI